MDLVTARTAVRESTGRTDKDSLINIAINLAMTKISAARLWSQLKSDATGVILISTSSVALVADGLRFTEFRIIDGTNSYPLPIFIKEFVVKRFPDVATMAAARPACGYLQGKTLHVVPITDQAYNFAYSYYRNHPALVADSDLILFDGADAAVTAYGSYWVFLSLQQSEDAAGWLALFQDELAAVRALDKVTATDIVLQPFVGAVLDRRVPPNFWLDPFIRKVP